MNNKEILIKLKEVIDLDSKYSEDFGWDGIISFTGLKRLLYGLWNDGKNELSQDMTIYMAIEARIKYFELIELCRNIEPMTIYIKD